MPKHNVGVARAGGGCGHKHEVGVWKTRGAGGGSGHRRQMYDAVESPQLFFFLEAVMRKSDLWASKCRFIDVIMWIYRCGNVDLCNVHDVTCRPGERGYQQGH